MRRTVNEASPRPAVFIDRDGTIIEERGYLADPEGVALLPGTADALKSLNEAGFALVVVTNQSGIARGSYSETEYRAVADRLDGLLRDAGAPVHLTLHCPHHPDFGEPCDCRKPEQGMHRRAAAELQLDLENSYYVGDKIGDVLPAAELGGQGILVRTGYGRDEELRVSDGVVVVDDLHAAARRIAEWTSGVDPSQADG